MTTETQVEIVSKQLNISEETAKKLLFEVDGVEYERLERIRRLDFDSDKILKDIESGKLVNEGFVGTHLDVPEDLPVFTHESKLDVRPDKTFKVIGSLGYYYKDKAFDPTVSEAFDTGMLTAIKLIREGIIDIGVGMQDTQQVGVVEKIGDLMEAEVDAIAHQCNCISKGYNGLAATVFDEYPTTNTYDKNPRPSNFSTIEVFDVECAPFKKVINMFSQLYPGPPGQYSADTVEARLKSFKWCLEEIAKLDIQSVAFPKYIGCGLAGGNWDDYQKVINDWAAANPGLQVQIIEKVS